MKGFIMLVFLAALPAAVSAQGPAAPEALPGVNDMRTEALESAAPVQRPDSQKIIAELSAALRLSSGQEQRISDAVNRKTAQFDKLMKEFDRNSEEEKNWRYKMNASRYEMVKLNRGIPDTIREFLDDEQREKYDSMVTADNKPAAAVSPAAETPAPAVRASKPRKMKRVLRRKKAQVQAPAPAAPAAAVPADDEAGQVMVDKEPAARSKAAPAQEEDAGSYP